MSRLSVPQGCGIKFAINPDDPDGRGSRPYDRTYDHVERMRISPNN